jgi:lysophospholipase L1-like esterase
MSRFIACLLCILALLSVAGTAEGQTLSTAPFPFDMFGNAPSRVQSYAVKQLVPVGNCGIYPSEGGTSQAGAQFGWRRTCYFPQGAKSLQLLFTGTYVTTGGELNIGFPVPMNLGYELSVCPLWNSTTTYAIGACVSFNQAQGEQWTAVSSNTNSQPTSTNANWSVNTAPTSGNGGILPIGLGGVRAFGLTTSQGPSGTTLTQGLVKTDLVPVNIPVAGWSAFRGWDNQTGLQDHYLARPINAQMGDFSLQNTGGVTDVSLGGQPGVTHFGYSYGDAPVAVIGVPQVEKPTFVIIASDSRASGYSGVGITPGSPGTPGGTMSGFVAGDVGTICSYPNTGGSTYAVSRPGRFMISAVSAGSVTSVIVYDPGTYTNTALNGGTLPNGTLTITGCGSGTGMTLASYGLTTGQQSYDFGDQYGGKGFVERGLDLLGYSFLNLARGGDTLANFLSSPLARMQIACASGATNAILEGGINDISTVGASAATVEGNLKTIANSLLLGCPSIKAVWLTTYPPEATSTDGFETTGNQSQNAHNSVRVAVNDWIRANAIAANGFAGYIEIANTVESAQDSGYWAPGGVGNVCVTTCDGIHLTDRGAATAAQAFVTMASSFIYASIEKPKLDEMLASIANDDFNSLQYHFHNHHLHYRRVA